MMMKPGACSNRRCCRCADFGLARLGQHSLGGLGADDKDAADAVGCRLVVDRAVAVGPVDVLAPAMPGDRHQRVFVPGGAAASHDLIDLRTDDIPDLVPDLPGRLAERAGMPLRADRLAVGVIVEAGQIGPPPDIHRVSGVQHQAHGGAQRLRPGRRIAERRGGPIVGPHQPPHLAAAGEKRKIVGLLAHQSFRTLSELGNLVHFGSSAKGRHRILGKLLLPGRRPPPLGRRIDGKPRVQRTI